MRSVAQLPVLALCMALAVGCSPERDGSKDAATPPPVPISRSSDFYVDPETPAALQVREWAQGGRAADADQLRKIAERPLPLWPRGEPGQVRDEVASYVQRAAAAKKRPLLVAANLPPDVCSGVDADPYTTWFTFFADGLGDTTTTVVLEPGAVTRALGACSDTAQQQVYGLLTTAVEQLKSAGAVVYLDAGTAPEPDLQKLAAALRSSGVAEADGFSINVGATRPTPETTVVGSHLSDLLDEKHFVIDTSRNGGPPGPTSTAEPAGCNPPGAVLGPAPTTDTGSPRVDALLWIDRPGESDGPCRPGEPAVGQWWPAYALDIAKRSE